MEKYDVIIIGSGPSGSTAARYIAKNNISVLVIDKKKKIGFPVQCAGFIPNSKELKLLIPSLKIPDELKNINQNSIYTTIKSQTIDFSGKFSKKFNVNGYIVNREIFDSNLANSAKLNGAIIKCNNKAISIKNGIIKVKNEYNIVESYKPKIIIGADGPRSVVKQSFYNNSIISNSINQNFYTSFQYKIENVDIDTTNIKIYFFGREMPYGYLWIFPEGENKLAIGIGVKYSYQRSINKTPKELLDYYIKSNIQIYNLINKGSIKSKNCGIIPSFNFENTIFKNMLLIGDSAGHVIATNGGGIPYSIIGGKIAGDSVSNNILYGHSLENYSIEWNKEFGSNLKNSVEIRNKIEKVISNDKLQLLLKYSPSKIIKKLQCGVYPPFFDKLLKLI